MSVPIVAAALMVGDVMMSAMKLYGVFNEIMITMKAEGRTELTTEEVERIKSLRKEAVQRALDTD